MYLSCDFCPEMSVSGWGTSCCFWKFHLLHKLLDSCKGQGMSLLSAQLTALSSLRNELDWLHLFPGPLYLALLLLSPSKSAFPLNAPYTAIGGEICSQGNQEKFFLLRNTCSLLNPCLQSFHPHHPADINVRITSLTDPMPFSWSSFSPSSL